jgi:uncharacterized protein YqjF (DUF2071 family)
MLWARSEADTANPAVESRTKKQDGRYITGQDTGSRDDPVVNSTRLGVCPFEIDRPAMLHRWDSVTFLHWSCPPPVVQQLLPPSLSVDTFDGRAWVGLVPFFMEVTVPHVPVMPWVSRFCETNVRTYARDASGRTGVWFLSLDAARLGAVVTARATYRMPYFWSAMRLTRTASTIAYSCARRWPGPGARSEVVVDIGEPYAAGELTALDHWLTARFLLFSMTGRRQRIARASHRPWPLHRATARAWRDELVAAAGLPAPAEPPVVHYSPGVDVRVGRPEK